MEHTGALLREEIAVAELGLPQAGMSVRHNIFLTPAFTKLHCSPVILEAFFLESEVWLLQMCKRHEIFTLLIHRQSKHHLLYESKRQAAACSFLINYLPEKENFPIWEHFVCFVNRR